MDLHLSQSAVFQQSHLLLENDPTERRGSKLSVDTIHVDGSGTQLFYRPAGVGGFDVLVGCQFNNKVMRTYRRWKLMTYVIK